MAAVFPADIPTERERALRRARFMAWLRRAHGWIGLWGAVLGFLMGGTGIVMAHRAVLKLPISKGEQSVVQVKLAGAPATPAALAAQVARDFGFSEPPRVKVEPARTVTWNGVSVQQPERWEINLIHPQRQAKVEYYAGNGFAKMEKYDANLMGTLTRLHQSTGVSAFWVLLMDTIAASLMLLALTGTILWTQLRGSRVVFATLLLGAPLAAVLGFAAMV